MSNKLKKIISVTTSVTTIVWVSGIAMLAPMAASAVVGNIAEGDTIRVANTFDVYIAKYVGTKQFKRLILNPDVFNSYGHLSWSKVKTVTQAEMDQFVTSELVRGENDPKVYKLTPNGDEGTKQWVNMTAEQFVIDGYDWDSIYQINNVDRDNYTTGTDIGPGGVPPVVSGTLFVGLASNTAPASTLVDGSAAANLASFTFTAPSTNAVKVTTLKVKRLGVSADTTLTNVYLYDGVNRLTDSATVSSGYVTWVNSAGIFTVPAGASMTVMVKSDIADSVAGQTIGISINAAADIMTDGATISGVFPINGNIHSTANAELATVSFGSVTPSSDGTPNPQNEFMLWSSQVSVSRAVDLQYITFRQIGSVLQNDLANFKLFIAGAQVGNTVSQMDANGYITFDLTGMPKRLQTSAEFKILVDIVGGSGRTTSLSIRNAADAVFVDAEFGANILVQAASSTFTPRTSTAQTIGVGALTFVRTSDSPSGSIVKDGSSISLGKFELRASGENIKIENLTVTVDESSNPAAFELRNGALYADGMQVGSTFSLKATSDATATTTVNLGSSLVVVPGTPRILEVKADIFDRDGDNNVTAGRTLTVRVSTGSSNAQKMTSLSFFAAPLADVTGNALVIGSGSLSLAKYSGFANQSAVAPKTSAYKLGEWRLTAGTTENVNLTALEPDFDNSAGPDVVSGADIGDCYFTYADRTTTSQATVASTTSSYSISYTLSAGATIPIAFYCNRISTTISGTSQVDLTVNGTTVQSGASANSSEATGQVITWTSGELAAQALESPLDQVVYGGQTVTAATFELTATNDGFSIDKFTVKTGGLTATDAVVTDVQLWYGTTQLTGSLQYDGTYATTTFPTALRVEPNTTKQIIAKLVINNIGTGNGTSAKNASTTLTSILYRSDSTGVLTYLNPSSSHEGNLVLVYKTYPTLTLTGSEAVIIASDVTSDIYKFTVRNNGLTTLAIKQFKLALNWSDVGPSQADLELEAVKVLKDGNDITSTMTIVGDVNGDITDGSGATFAKASGTGDTVMVFAFATEDQIDAGATVEYRVRATPRNFNSGGASSSSDQVVLTMNAGTSELGSTARYVIQPDNSKIWSIGTSATQGTAGTAANFIWSDRNVLGHNSTSGSSTADWFNGYKIKNLPLNSVTLKATL